MNQVDQFLRQYHLSDYHVYLLDLIPLITMVWADGKNQEAELAIVQQFATTHLANLAKQSEGLLPVSVEATNEFINRFTRTPPSEDMLNDLNTLCIERLSDHRNIQYSKAQADQIMDFCLDIAAACAKNYPYEYDERIVRKEKETLKRLLRQLSSI